jgi:proteasome lid subunit RPN8/RPN11
MKERCWVLTGKFRSETGLWRIARTCKVEGKPHSVEADWAWALSREESSGDVMGFFHTHPGGFGTYPSDRDSRTMRAWYIALGKPLLCMITAGGEISGYVYQPDLNEGKRVMRIAPTGPDRFWIQ